VHGRAIAAHYLVRACWEEPISTLERYGPFGAALAPAPPTVLQDALLHEALLRKILGELEPLFFVGEAKKKKKCNSVRSSSGFARVPSALKWTLNSMVSGTCGLNL